MALWVSLFCVLAIPCLFYYYLRRKFSYWRDRGVPFVKPSIPMGNMGGVGTKITFGQMLQNIYMELKDQGPLAGLYMFTEPAVLIVDMDLARNVFVKDFQYFQDRGVYMNEKDDPLAAHLLGLEGERWKKMRSLLTPTFTSGKMKMMHSGMLSVTDQFKGHLNGICKDGVNEAEFKDLFCRLTTDVIGHIAFGVDCNSLKDPNSDFRRIGRSVVEIGTFGFVQDIFTQTFPNLSRKLHLTTNSKEVTDFFLNLVKDTVKYREENNVERNDFLSLLIKVKNTGRIDGESSEFEKISLNALAAQVFLFFVGGFETSASTLTFALYELALNPDIQEKARIEVHDVLARHGGELNYEAATELQYVDQIIQETLRKYPVFEMHMRVTKEPYKVPDTGLIIEKGKLVFIPVLGMHHDAEIFPKPEQFDPDRFSKDAAEERHQYAWTPFGKGPRDCIGKRFAMMQIRLAIAVLLKDFKVSPSKKTNIPLKFQPDSQFLSPAGGMFLNIESN